MSDISIDELKSRRCLPCEGGVPAVSRRDAERLLRGLEGWSLGQDGQVIEKKWTVQNFMAGMEFLNQVAELAERDQHHPDIHLTGYRHIRIQLTTHSIGGLSENDFILAAKINELPIKVKNS